MCGIVGYIGHPEKTKDIILDGLTRLEYRGYDSSGLAVLAGSSTNIVKSKGKIANLFKLAKDKPLDGNLGIGHTRWATHGIPSRKNAHPHKVGPVSVVHNGIVENYVELRDELLTKGIKLKSDTDTEIIAHLVELKIKDGLNFTDAVRQSFLRIKGAYAAVLISETEPDKLIAIKNFSSVVLGVGEHENYVASDVPAILPYTKNIVYLEDGDIAVIEKNGLKIKNMEGQAVKREIVNINWDSVNIEKSGYKHYMLKEIYEQPRSAMDTARGRISGDCRSVLLQDLDGKLIAGTQRIVALGCGTSYHACMIGKQYIESLTGIPVEVDLASEFRYRNPTVDKYTLVIAVSQSGETADTSEAIIEAKRRGAKVLSITNVIRSKIERQSEYNVQTHAGPEIGVASTKAFTTQLEAFYLLAIYFGVIRKKLNADIVSSHIHNVVNLPISLEKVLKLDPLIQRLAMKYHSFGHFIFLGRGLNYPIALEGALKLKEVSYIHAEGYAAGEMKHGPIALIDEHVPVVIIAPYNDINYSKTVGNLREVKSRNGQVIFLTTEGRAAGIEDCIDDLIEIPECDYFVAPIISIVPLQLLAYHIARIKGTDVDQPRNLAKVVTVE